LEACDAQTVSAVEQAITAFSRPFIDKQVHELLRRGEPLIYDLDLTGPAVSATSQTYPGVAFGWMNDRVKLGYQLARVCLSSATQERIGLAGFHHPGDTVSVSCVQDLIRAAEAQTGVRPRRRPELVQKRIAAQQDLITRTQRLLEQHHQALTHLRQTHTALIGKIYHTEMSVKEALSAQKSAHFQQQVASWQRRLPRLEKQLATCQQVIAKHQNGCPYPLTVALERFKTGRQHKYATLIQYRDEGQFPTLPVWFHHSNERQTIEAGNKEMKSAFFVQHLMSRSLAGIQLQVLFTGLAANVVQWCTPWLQSCAPTASPKFQRTLSSPKYLVHMAANTDALVQQAPHGTTLQFAPHSPLAGLILFLKGVPAFQLSLGFNRPHKIESG
jgi:hypothetical protein